jgi:hypothetical protein
MNASTFSGASAAVVKMHLAPYIAVTGHEAEGGESERGCNMRKWMQHKKEDGKKRFWTWRWTCSS